MRLRNIPGAREEMAVNPYVVHDAEKVKGSWKKYLLEEWKKSASSEGDAAENAVVPDENSSLNIEIGCGKGQFIVGLAKRNPDRFYVGIEKYSSVLLRAVTRQEEAKLPNLRFLRLDAEDLAEVFAPGEVDCIYLNFSDPWPKDRHSHRRLTSDRFLARYRQVLAKDAHIEFKTDNQDLFTFSLETAQECGWKITVNTRDLHADPVLNEGNIMTEYEEKFSAAGNPICKMVIEQPEGEPEALEQPVREKPEN